MRRIGLLLILLWAGEARAQQNPDGVMPLGGLTDPYLLLLHDPVVHQELRLDQRQRRTLAGLCDEIDVEYWSVRNKAPREAEEISSRLRNTAQQRLTTLFNDAQRRRLSEIEIRTIGLQSLLRKDIAQRVGLTEPTQEKIRGILARTKQSVVELEKDLKAGTPRKELEQRLTQLRRDEQSEVWNLLSRDQQTRLKTAVGEPLDLDQLGRIKLKPPEFPEGNVWINSSPLTLRQLEGKVVVLFYWTYG